MDKTSTASDLSRRLREKTEQDSEQSRALILTEQKKLVDDLNRSYKEGLNTTLSDIQESLKSRLGQMAMLTANEAQTVERMVQQHQEKLTAVLASHYSQARKAIRSQVDPAQSALSNMTTSVGELTAALDELKKEAKATASTSRKRRLWGVLAILFVFLTICAGSWGLIQYLSSQVQSQLTTIQSQRATLEALQDRTSGIDLYQDKTGRYIVLPPNSDPKSGWKIGDRPAVKF